MTLKRSHVARTLGKSFNAENMEARMNELSNAIQRFDFINKSKSQLADWRIIRAAASEALKPSHNSAITPCAHRFVPVDGLTVKGAEICIKCHSGRTAQ